MQKKWTAFYAYDHSQSQGRQVSVTELSFHLFVSPKYSTEYA
jgi:hypothetical protein